MTALAGRRVLLLPPEDIVPNPSQPRRIFEEDGLRELAESIRRWGVLQPLTVRRRGENWELVAGERRLRAAMLAGLAAVPCLPIEAEDTDSALLALTENLQRRDLHFLEEAAALSAYLRKTGETQEELAAKLGRSASALANKLRLLKLSPGCVREILAGGLSERVRADKTAAFNAALAEAGEEPSTAAISRRGPRSAAAEGTPAEAQAAAAKHIRERQLSVAQAERYLAALPAQAAPRGRRSYILKDVRLFLNSVDRGLRVIREAGVDAQTERQETEDAIILTIRIPRGLPGKTVTGL